MLSEGMRNGLQDEGKQEQRDHDGSQQRCAGLSKGGQMIAQMVECDQHCRAPAPGLLAGAGSATGSER